MDDSYKLQPQSDDLTEVTVSEILDDESFDSFVSQLEGYLVATADSAYLLLIDPDDAIRCRGVFNCWTLGRHDPRPLILLRRLLPWLSGRSLIDGISVLAHATSHPDIFWTKHNWISPVVEDAVQASFRWWPDELAQLVNAVEMMDDGGSDWQRGGIGQSLWSIMAVDPGLCSKLPAAIRTCVDTGKVEAAVRLLICYQFLTDDPIADVDVILAQNPALAEHEMIGWIVEELHLSGRFPVY